jgi:hypothetical protein
MRFGASFLPFDTTPGDMIKAGGKKCNVILGSEFLFFMFGETSEKTLETLADALTDEIDLYMKHLF